MPLAAGAQQAALTASSADRPLSRHCMLPPLAWRSHCPRQAMVRRPQRAAAAVGRGHARPPVRQQQERLRRSASRKVQRRSRPPRRAADPVADATSSTAALPLMSRRRPPMADWARLSVAAPVGMSTPTVQRASSRSYRHCAWKRAWRRRWTAASAARPPPPALASTRWAVPRPCTVRSHQAAMASM